jgi:hypothetical protein
MADMRNERKRIAEMILALLVQSGSPLKARDITAALQHQDSNVTKNIVNSVLYNDLSTIGQIIQDDEYRWAVVDQGTTDAVIAQGAHLQSGTDELRPTPEECRAARRILSTLRAGTTSRRTAKAISVGTTAIEEDIYSRLQALFSAGARDEIIVVAADWGFGKSHLRMLLSSYLSERGIPFVHECIDARAASLSHIHRSVSRWLERIQFRRTLGLRAGLENGCLSSTRALEWARGKYFDFANGLRAGLGGYEWGWLLALGHLYRSPDYSYQHPKAWALLETAAKFLNNMDCGGLVLLLDEAENIDKQYDIRGRRKSYETLARMMRHPHILPIMFVTDRLPYQVEKDFEYGRAHGWANWSADARWFVSRFRELQPLRTPLLTDRLAAELVTGIGLLYRIAYSTSSELLTEAILDHWRRTPTRSIRLLVRLTINALDLMEQR